MSASHEQALASREDIERLSRQLADLQARMTKLQTDVDVIREILARLARTGF